MRKFDVYWKSNKEWYEYDGLVPKLKEDAPKEAQESFEHYLQQKKETATEERTIRFEMIEHHVSA